MFNRVFYYLFLLLSLAIYANTASTRGSGALFNVTGSGGQEGSLIVKIWLNGDGALSGQTFQVTGGHTLTVTPTTQNHSYLAIGLEIATDGFAVTAGCDRVLGNRCIFSTSASSPRQLTVSSTKPLQCSAGNVCNVFIMNTITNGDIIGSAQSIPNCVGTETGVDAANCICNNDLYTPASGTYKAWLSQTNPQVVSALTNIGYNSRYNLTYINQQGGIVITPGDTNFPASLNQAIGNNSAYLLWTGTQSDGTPTSPDSTLCNSGAAGAKDWNTSSSGGGAVGHATDSDSNWTNFFQTYPCSNSNWFYCFEEPQ